MLSAANEANQLQLVPVFDCNVRPAWILDDRSIEFRNDPLIFLAEMGYNVVKRKGFSEFTLCSVDCYFHEFHIRPKIRKMQIILTILIQPTGSRKMVNIAYCF